MEDKVTVKVPHAYYSGSVPTALDKGVDGPNFGGSVCGNPALITNLIQFLTGAPLVDYDSISITPSGSQPTGVVGFIDTSRRVADETAYSALTRTDTFINFSQTRMQTRAFPSQADDTYTVTISGGAATYSIADSGAGTLYSDSGGISSSFAVDTPEDAYDGSGNFLFSIFIKNTPFGGAAGFWTAGDTVDFTINSYSYTTELNWGEIANTTRLDTNETFGVTGLMYDTRRGPGQVNSDPMEDFYFVGLTFESTLAQCFISGMDEIAGNFATARGDFHTLSGTEAAITTSVTGGRSFGSTTPSAAFRQPDTWTIFRGPGYFRILAQVEDYTNPGTYVFPERDNVYFYGLMNCYQHPDEYKFPIAFFGDTYADANTTPWFRLVTDSQAYVEESAGEWRYTGPFILNRNFSMDGTLDENDDIHLPYPYLPDGVTVPDFDSNTGGTRAMTVGSKDDSTPTYVTRMCGAQRETFFDSVVSWDCVEKGVAERLSGTHILDRIVETFPICQHSNDGYLWDPETNYDTFEFTWDALTYQGNMEAFGTLPGIYWTADKLHHHTVSSFLSAPAGDENTIQVNGENRTLRTVIGASTSVGSYVDQSVTTEDENEYGNIMFDMNEV